MARIIARISLLLIGIAFLTCIAKAQTDSLKIEQNGKTISVPVQEWNEIATEYNRLKFVEEIANKVIINQGQQINELNDIREKSDSACSVLVKINHLLQTENEALQSSNESLLLRNNELEANAKSKFVYFSYGYGAGVASVFLIKAFIKP